MQTKEFKIIHEISDIISQATDYRSGLRLTVKTIAECLNADCCNIYVHNKQNNNLVLQATYGLKQHLINKLKYPINQGILGKTFSSKEATYCQNKTEDKQQLPKESEQEKAFQSFLTIPLIVAGTAIGVLEIKKCKTSIIDDKLIAMTKAISTPLAIFIMNANLVQEAEKQEETTNKKSTDQLVLHGEALTQGLVIGTAYLLAGAELLKTVSLSYSKEIQQEKQKFNTALKIAREETKKLHTEASEILAEADAAIFYTHNLLLEDPTLLQRINKSLEQGFSLPFSLRIVSQEFEKELTQLDNEFLRERLADLNDVVLRIFQASQNCQNNPQRINHKTSNSTPLPPQKHIIITRELLPSQLLQIPLSNLGGIISEHGGTTTHVAILAKALQIPMIVGVEKAFSKTNNQDNIILDCSTNTCYIRPTTKILNRFKKTKQYTKQSQTTTKQYPQGPAYTNDKIQINLNANISLTSQLPLLNHYGAQGVGLYRTEFMFIIRGSYPSEQEQYKVFKRIITKLKNKPLTIRLLDIGGDKPLPYINFDKEDNPFLGWRGLRFLLSNPNYLIPHLRAILRASIHGTVRILIPMVATTDELLEIKKIINYVKQQLKQSRIPFNNNIQLGIMIEIPSALWCLENMLPHIDFISIGTNDLTQYTFAVDRGNAKVTKWFKQFHPVVLKMIKQTCDIAATLPNITVALCGEIAGNNAGIPLLIGAGLTQLSMSPWRIPSIRKTIAKLTIPQCQEIFNQASQLEIDNDVINFMAQYTKKYKLLES